MSVRRAMLTSLPSRWRVTCRRCVIVVVGAQRCGVGGWVGGWGGVGVGLGLGGMTHQLR
jgi:hypothetical protein